MIHTNRRAQCLLCQKDYSTLKSLINHVRKYHTDKKGKEYLQTFLQVHIVCPQSLVYDILI